MPDSSEHASPSSGRPPKADAGQELLGDCNSEHHHHTADEVATCDSSAPAPSGSCPLGEQAPIRWDSQTILQGNCEVLIVHENETYRLRQTRNNKLILHK